MDEVVFLTPILKLVTYYGLAAVTPPQATQIPKGPTRGLYAFVSCYTCTSKSRHAICTKFMNHSRHLDTYNIVSAMRKQVVILLPLDLPLVQIKFLMLQNVQHN